MNERLHKSIYGQTLDEMKEDKGAWEYEQEPSLEAFKQVMWERDIAIEQLHELGYELGQKIEPSGDLISRQAVLDAIEELKKIHFDRVVVLNKVRDRVLALLPVNPQESYDFAKWVAREIFDEMWEYNQDAFAELACRKLAKLGIVRAKGDEWELVESQTESEEV